MTDYTPSGDPLVGSRGISSLIRSEFDAVATAISSKQNSNALSTVSITPTLIPVSAPSAISMVWEIGKSFLPGYYVTIVDRANPATMNMFGMILSYNIVSGATSINITSYNGSGTLSDWVIVTTSQAGVTLGSNTFIGFQNFSRATVVSDATTSDIWGALGNQIDFTGTATVTAFPDAPQGGATRELICAGACVFTAGANMLIDGVGSGSSVTCAANDIVIVRAITTTQFRLTRQRYDGLQQKLPGDLQTVCVTGNGTGSSIVTVRLLTTTSVNTLGSTVSHSATNGTSIVVPYSGKYTVQARDYYTGAAPPSPYWGISLNATSGVTTDGNLAIVALGLPSASGQMFTISDTLNLVAGDTIRLLCGGASYMNATSNVRLSVKLLDYYA